MSISNLTHTSWKPTTTSAPAPAQAPAPAETGAPGGALFAASTSTSKASAGANLTIGNATVGSTDPAQQLSAALQAFLTQLQGGSSGAGAAASTGGTQQALATPQGSETVSGSHRRDHRHPEAGQPKGGDLGSVSPEGDSANRPLNALANSLFTDIAKAVRSYARAGAAPAGAGTASASTAGVALAA